ncbi:Uncharacterized protein GBIM_15130 [Gryllus bimaculatus]|nr:Uncharacterized protein GBIM_15130 [Gryllus bimaculatus]
MISRSLIFATCGAVLVLVLLEPRGSDAAVARVLHSLVRNNLAGTPDNFRPQRWPFDPAVAQHWREEYERQNGVRGEALIERLGLGEDARTEERRAQQTARDRGVYVSHQPRLHRP